MVTRRLLLVSCSTVAVAVLMVVSPASALAGRGNGPTGVIYVSSQGLYYDTIGLFDLPPNKGPFQTLCVQLDDEGEIAEAVTEYGPGDRGYLGGRWEAYIFNSAGDLVDVRYFECPLLPPGRDEP